MSSWKILLGVGLELKVSCSCWVLLTLLLSEGWCYSRFSMHSVDAFDDSDVRSVTSRLCLVVSVSNGCMGS